jgi:S-methylmethionine-dependent homocysteine/selenocysteine methylase
MSASTRTPWPASGTVVTDGGLETWLLFDRDVDLPEFAAYPLAATDDGRRLLDEYYGYYVAIADAAGAHLLLETPTWRANPDWAARLGHDRAALGSYIEAGVDVVRRVGRRAHDDRAFLVSGAVGPRGDGYVLDALMDADTAAEYHSFQVERLVDAGVDVVTAMTLGYVEEAVGVVRAAAAAGAPVVIAFTVETDATLPSGMALADAIEATDVATDGYATHFMVNCAHPTHFLPALDPGRVAFGRIAGIRANASTMSHAELDEMTELDAGDPAELAARYLELGEALPQLQVLGGCCGTDHRHVGAIVDAWAGAGR